jgi:hypothetical protein
MISGRLIPRGQDEMQSDNGLEDLVTNRVCIGDTCYSYTSGGRQNN